MTRGVFYDDHRRNMRNPRYALAYWWARFRLRGLGPRTGHFFGQMHAEHKAGK